MRAAGRLTPPVSTHTLDHPPPLGRGYASHRSPRPLGADATRRMLACPGGRTSFSQGRYLRTRYRRRPLAVKNRTSSPPCARRCSPANPAEGRSHEPAPIGSRESRFDSRPTADKNGSRGVATGPARDRYGVTPERSINQRLRSRGSKTGGGWHPMRFEKQTRIRAPPEAVFAFHENPGALERLTPPWERVRLLEGGGSIRPGTRVVLAVPFGPFRMKWIAEHTEYEPDRMFADRQIRGPFASWYHRHLCIDDGQGGTILRDEIDYELPFGVLGRLFGSWLVRAKLAKMFDYRHEVTRRIVEAGGPCNSAASDH